MTGCDVLEDSKATLEQHYLAEHESLAEIIKEIRDTGLTELSNTNISDTKMLCVVNKLNQDPIGHLIELEGSLQESANIADLLASMSQLAEQEITLDSLPGLLRQGADTISYLKHLLINYDIQQLQGELESLINSGAQQTQNIGDHLTGLIEGCE